MPTEVLPRHSEKLEALPYELSYIPDDLRRRAKSELFEDEETRVHSLRLLRSMLKGIFLINKFFKIIKIAFL